MLVWLGKEKAWLAQHQCKLGRAPIFCDIVTLFNVGRTIAVPDGQTILSAALAEGVDVPHGCKSGRCRSCKSRLCTGEVEFPEHSRFALTPEVRDGGLVLAFRAVPIGPVNVVWLEDEDNAASRPLREAEAEVVGAGLLTHDISGLRLRVACPVLDHAPDKYALLALPGVPARDHTMANAPGTEELKFHIERHSWAQPS